MFAIHNAPGMQVWETIGNVDLIIQSLVLTIRSLWASRQAALEQYVSTIRPFLPDPHQTLP